VSVSAPVYLQGKELPTYKDVDFRNNLQKVYVSSEEKEKVLRDSLGPDGGDVDRLPPVEYQRPPGATGQEPPDPRTRERRAKVKEVGSSTTFCTGRPHVDSVEVTSPWKPARPV
jgi:hypothetical protein